MLRGVRGRRTRVVEPGGGAGPWAAGCPACHDGVVDLVTFERLQTDEGRALVAEVHEGAGRESDLALGTRLRKVHDVELVAAAVTQNHLRGLARAKLGDDAAAMFFTHDALQQATRGTVATLRAERLAASGASAVLDLGCGTGLTGMALADCTGHRTGVDLSERIVELAYDREVYDDLYVGEAVAFLEEFEEDDGSRPSWDMIAATDVFPYLGAVEPFLAGAVDRLKPRSYLAFSTETLSEEALEGRPYMVGPKSRFAQGEGYIRSSLDAAGFDILAMDPITVRLEDGDPVPGHLVIARLR